MEKAVDLNADLGEGAGFDAELIRVVSSVNLCCGLHAGNLAETETVLRLAGQEARKRQILVGAHPGLPDRAGKGRVSLELPASTLGELVQYQVEVLDRMARSHGLRLSHLKPHGALYHQACARGEVAEEVARVAVQFNLAVVGLPGSALALASSGRTPFLAEGFVERGYKPDGGLIPRGEPGDLIQDPMVAGQQAVDLARRGLETLCVHGDSPGAISLTRQVRLALLEAGYEVQPWTRS